MRSPPISMGHSFKRRGFKPRRRTPTYLPLLAVLGALMAALLVLAGFAFLIGATW